MKVKLLVSLVLFSSICSLNAQEEKMDSLSYSLGVLVAQNLKSQGFDECDKAKAFKREFDPNLRKLAVEFSQRVKTLLIRFHHKQIALGAEVIKPWARKV